MCVGGGVGGGGAGRPAVIILRTASGPAASSMSDAMRVVRVAIIRSSCRSPSCTWCVGCRV